MDQCKQQVWPEGITRSRRCKNPIQKDGYCNIHHPETIEKKHKERAERFREKQKRIKEGYSGKKKNDIAFSKDGKEI